MSNNNNERRELTAAELDLVVGGVILENVQITSYASFSWSETQTGTTGVMYDIRQNRTV
jgi:hypothetical protein